jgi:hypothetical protein
VAGYEWAIALQIAEAIRGRGVSAAEVLAGQLERITRVDAEPGAVVTLDAEGARARAEKTDKALARGEVRGPLHGVGITPYTSARAAFTSLMPAAQDGRQRQVPWRAAQRGQSSARPTAQSPPVG